MGSRYYAATVCGGFDIYDNQAKERLTPSYPSRTDAQVQCEQLNKRSEVG
ncbi:hypothetical protein PPUJ20005_44680 [Pseudomonas putida]|uniref:Uncharacterized protein n=1 Tax=Pseudomonas putida NBRC 14164 TaxID=1211579 RepID=A0ABM7EEI1_PSEPU|nr:hypothetical protein PP4_24120 [Pseudomonas putida NBRC 14164]GLO10499.1 hypothetical protein PPUJ20005_44680 [Pseudomonas putida]GLO25464.1 hypothetical protein PPUJ21368_32930 [Pseudomonas putida]